jgi:hypothetical protein
MWQNRGARKEKISNITERLVQQLVALFAYWKHCLTMMSSVDLWYSGWWKALLICADIAFLDSFDNSNTKCIAIKENCTSNFFEFLNNVLAFPLSAIQELWALRSEPDFSHLHLHVPGIFSNHSASILVSSIFSNLLASILKSVASMIIKKFRKNTYQC